MGITVGDRLRAYDFEPMPDRSKRYIEGTVRSLINGTYIVEVEVDTLYSSSDARTEVIVPMKTLFDWEGRVIKI